MAAPLVESLLWTGRKITSKERVGRDSESRRAVADDACRPQRRDRGVVQPEQVAQDLVVVLAEGRRWRAVPAIAEPGEAHGQTGQLVRPGHRVRDLLEEAPRP